MWLTWKSSASNFVAPEKTFISLRRNVGHGNPKLYISVLMRGISSHQGEMWDMGILKFRNFGDLQVMRVDGVLNKQLWSIYQIASRHTLTIPFRSTTSFDLCTQFQTPQSHLLYITPRQSRNEPDSITQTIHQEKQTVSNQPSDRR